MNWPLGLDNANTYQQGSDNTSAVIRQATANILADMGALPATLMAGLVEPEPAEWFETPVEGQVAGALPVLASLGGAIAAEVTVSGQLGGALPGLVTLGGALHAVGPVTGGLAGALPALASLAGQLAATTPPPPQAAYGRMRPIYF